MHIILRCLLTLLFSLSGSAIGEYNAFGHSSFVVATPALQQAYVAEVEGLQGLGSSARAAGQNAEATARMLHAERRALGIQYKDLTPADDLLRITERNIKKYNDPLGPSIDWLRSQSKTWEQIIESASRSGGKDLGY